MGRGELGWIDEAALIAACPGRSQGMPIETPLIEQKPAAGNGGQPGALVQQLHGKAAQDPSLNSAVAPALP